MRKVLLTKKLSEKSRQLFEGIPDLERVEVLDGEPEQFASHVKDAEAVLLSTAYEMTSDVIAQAQNLKVISRTGVGVDNVDVTAATGKKILVLNTPGANSISVAEHAVALMLSLSKQLLVYDRELRNGNFKIRRSGKCVDIEGKTLGLIGCGAIGRLVADKCRASFNMQVIGYDPYIKELPNITLYEDLKEVFKQADYVSLHIPLTEETKNLVGTELLSLMKPTAFIINTSRGGIIDEQALADMIIQNKIAGAGLDVLESEPPKADNPLLPLDNVIMTPHSAALTKECSARVEFEAAQGISDYLKGNKPKYIFNRSGLE